MYAIDISHLSFEYRIRNQYIRVFHDFNLQIEAGEFICIIGPSGSGKSTLLNILAGLFLPENGTVRVNGRPLTGPGIERSVVFQHYSLFPWMTAAENVLFGIQQSKKGLKKRKARELAESYLAKVGMEKAIARYPFQLSGGMQQRVAIARAFAMDAQILLLDEPFGAQDARNRTELQQLLEYLWDAESTRKTVVFVTHDIEEAILLADRIIFMSPGKIETDLTVPFSRPRHRDDILKSENYEVLKAELRELFYLYKEPDADEEY